MRFKAGLKTDRAKDLGFHDPADGNEESVVDMCIHKDVEEFRSEAWAACRGQKEKSVKLMGAQNEVCDMAIKANVELEEVGARFAKLSHHYESLRKRSEDLEEEKIIQGQIVSDLQELCLDEKFELALKYAQIVDGEGRNHLISCLNEKAWNGHGHNRHRAEDIRAALDDHEIHGDIPF